MGARQPVLSTVMGMRDVHPRPASLWRRGFILGAPSVFAVSRLSADEAGADWAAFCGRFIQPDGRVVDTGNGGMSHTEGQGWGLLFAEHFGDLTTFDRILGWTSRVLRRPHDALHAWRYRPGDAHPVSDTNNATDGDLCIAWALARAARRWGAQDHAEAAAGIARDVLRLLTVRVDGKLVLLPGVAGFTRPAGTVVNPSYYVFPALAPLAQLVPSADWTSLQQHGRWLIEQGRFGHWMLPPDWLQLGHAGNDLAPARSWPPLCSFDAIRVPLYLVWAGLDDPVIGAFAAFYAPRGGTPPPAWVNLETDAEAPYAAPPGMLAVARIAAAVSAPPDGPINLPNVADAPDYYSAALTLLAHVAWQERRAA
jgi:endo-1,4-beta-D-glucanase Y